MFTKRTGTVAFFIVAPGWKHPRCASVGKWINKLWGVQMRNEPPIYSKTLDKSQKHAEQKQPDTRGHSV